jgi:hypothetical protein
MARIGRSLERDELYQAGAGLTCPAGFSATGRLVESVFRKGNGHKEVEIYGRADHRVSEAGREWHGSQGAVPQAWIQRRDVL